MGEISRMIASEWRRAIGQWVRAFRVVFPWWWRGAVLLLLTDLVWRITK